MLLAAENLLSLKHCPSPAAFQALQYPWEVLALIPDLIEQILQQNPGQYRQIAQRVWAAEGTAIADTARFNGPVLIGPDCDIRPNAYLRSNVLVGRGVVIGNATEIKQSILFDEVKAPHFNYVGDSVLGYGVHLGAGVILSNLKSTKSSVKIALGDKIIETGMRKLGAILGDHVEVGCNAVLNPGTIIGRGSLVYPLSSVRGFVPEKMIYKGPGNLAPLRE
ncbi:MAG: UDP-N-acetylglucosamine pyrophosphorylase [Firmicutes bacterium]|nr:UDP-N-acetylglucosamine pyrophosphorylase [Bacillota bacterium]